MLITLHSAKDLITEGKDEMICEQTYAPSQQPDDQLNNFRWRRETEYNLS